MELIKVIFSIISIFILIKWLIVSIVFCITFIFCRRENNNKIQLEEKKINNNINKSNNLNNKKIGEIKSSLFRFIGGAIRYSVKLTGNIKSHVVRNFIYKYVFKMKLSKNSVIYSGLEVRSPYNINIGEGSIIGDNCILDARHGIKIGKNVNFSTGVWIWTEQHNVNCKDFSCKEKGAPVIIEDRVWISNRTIILPGVTIGEGAVIAAGSVVTKDIKPYTICAGIPAHKIGERERALEYKFDGKHPWFI
ncbi:acyltransferase [Clostridium perfringens]|uniref:acyltransferase n=3 Tax=Clostridium perfringens TaxID=1502 RepID=UPI00290716D4|nr:acyltransferase [Clostridium perfringens]